MKKALLGYLLVSISGLSFAQQEPDEIALANNKFQLSYYEALKQKGIENYDKAIQSLENCLAIEPNNAAVFNELGRNYFLLKKYNQAYEAYEKAAQIEPQNRWYWHGMYDVSYQTKNYPQAITNVLKLVTFEPNYKEDLTSLYMLTQQYDKALALINEMNETLGKSEKRENYRKEIMKDADLLFIDGLFPDSFRKVEKHLNYEEAIDMARELRAKDFRVVHMSHVIPFLTPEQGHDGEKFSL